MCIVKPDGLPQLCKTDEIGEICVSSRTGGMMYFGLAGVTKNTFEVRDVFPRVLSEMGCEEGSPVAEIGPSGTRRQSQILRCTPGCPVNRLSDKLLYL